MKHLNRYIASLLALAILSLNLPIHIATVLANAPVRIPSHYYTGSFIYHSQYLFIATNNRGTVFTNGSNFSVGETIYLTAIPDRGHYLANYRATVGSLHTSNYLSFTYVMPSQPTTLYFYFEAGLPIPMYINPAEPMDWEPINTHRRLRSDNDVITSSVYTNYLFTRGEIIAIADRFATYSEIEALVVEHGGEIVGFLEVPNAYQLYFPWADESALRQIVELFSENSLIWYAGLNLVSRAPELYNPELAFEELEIELATLVGDFFPPHPSVPPVEYMVTPAMNDPGFIGEPAFPSDHPINRPPVPIPGRQLWGMEAINAPLAWRFNHLIEAPVPVGILDSFFALHRDLTYADFLHTNILAANREVDQTLPRWYYQMAGWINHGTHVAGTIGARTAHTVGSEANQGVTGVLWNSRLYAYSLFGVDNEEVVSSTAFDANSFTFMHGLATLFASGVELVNVSMGRGLATDSTANHTFDINAPHNTWLRRERDLLQHFLERYLSQGQEFLIVQAAGNSSYRYLGRNEANQILRGNPYVHIGYTGLFVNILDGPVSERILTVGNMTSMSLRASNSQVGPAYHLHIMAPGTDIYSTAFPNIHHDALTMSDVNNPWRSSIRRISGTSMAAPHATGVAGMVWGIDPHLTGADVRRILIEQSRRTENNAREYIWASPAPGVGWETPILDANRAVFHASQRANATTKRIPSTGYTTVFGSVKAFPSVSAPLTVAFYRNAERVEATNAIYAYERYSPQTSTMIRRYHFAAILPKGVYRMVVYPHVGSAFYSRTLDLTGEAAIPYQLVPIGLNEILLQLYTVAITTEPYWFLHLPAFLENDRTFAPLDPVASYLGATGIWLPERQEVHLTNENFHVIMPLDVDSETYFAETFYVVNLATGVTEIRQFYSYIGPHLVNGMVFLPVRSTATALGFRPIWYGEERRVNIVSEPMPRVRRSTGEQTNAQQYTPLVDRVEIGRTPWR